MNKQNWIPKCAALLVFFLAPLCVVSAQTDRTFVSALGDDANNCHRQTPCKTFAGASTRTNPGGEIDALDPGGFGSIPITKSITIDGGGFLASALITGTNGANINAGPGDVVILRHLSFASVPGPGGQLGTNGIRVIKARVVYVIDCLIKNFGNHGIDFEPSTGGLLFVTDSNILNNGTGPTDAGIFVKSGATNAQALAIIDHTRVERNRNGIVARDRSQVSISNCVIAGNQGLGLVAASDSTAPVEMNVESSVVTLNRLGIQSGSCAATGPAMVRISNVSVTNNAAEGLNHTVAAQGNGCGNGEIISARNNTILGNHPDGEPTAVPGQK
ncbi:MAG TPA: right-handed parallel beta-helix repeat-containing protein [Pyrinomonadaceae bacterium]|nr:right-handed parallel beta-helix repeat-containing protein [Pyrinomonadaceae bacterium]